MARTAAAAAVAVLLVAACVVAPSMALPFTGSTNAAGGKNWAVLVAGSNTWGNYRHQADVCHAYQVLISHGFDPDNIITFMYDDLAQNIQNPNKGVIINRPNGPNVYQGVRKDYTKNDVTPQNFLNVIKGNKAAMSGIGSGRVLESGPNDNVFINFVDHGGPGIIAFPSDVLQASDLNNALSYMNQNNMYAQLVFYLEACESGSMFQNILPTNTKIFATTAADATHSSYACYYDSTLHTYLGDVYSVNWMENSDSSDLRQETLYQQYTIVKQETNTSTVCQFGDTSFDSSPVIDFLGGNNSTATLTHLHSADGHMHFRRRPTADAIDSRMVEIDIMLKRIAEARDDQETRTALQQELVSMLQLRADTRARFGRIVSRVAGEDSVERHMTTRLSLPDYTCVEKATRAFHDACLNLGANAWALEHTMAFVSMCSEGADPADIVAAINDDCSVKTMKLKL
ncbi:legumain [Salpingoeca rosetta]|uniref:legumain n=1 Tax=Salpingoeca rosetta (strain ATCC 50818 / BSB-021) TaxID=946362 RepID=F2U0N9_SALR5|nr:legumain [Salpingoeca rosetta]EGD80967.1 legumain [Salpingoeca rosetta]|eukprot:XP_004997528.1 legumain [Salpingoeca rosetta]